MKKGEAIEQVREFSKLQGCLVRHFLELYHPVDRERFRDVRDGEFLIHGELWRHQRHGAGVLFVGPDNVSVDAHVAMADFPDAVDAGRLCEYFESVGISIVGFCEQEYDVAVPELDRMLVEMTRVGVLREVNVQSPYPRRFFELISRPDVSCS
jgi:hypothetical protein